MDSTQTSGRHPDRLSLAIARALGALDAAENKRLTQDELRRNAGVTSRGFNILVPRMEGRSLIAWDRSGARPYLTLTWGGMKALRAHRSTKAEARS